MMELYNFCCQMWCDWPSETYLIKPLYSSNLTLVLCRFFYNKFKKKILVNENWHDDLDDEKNDMRHNELK